MKKSRTPQEKKELSYKKDTRNNYGENSKASRKNIPKSRRRVNKTYRTTINHTIKKNITSNPNEIEDLDSAIKNVKKKYWKKSPDISLGHYLENKKEPVYQGNHIDTTATIRKRFYKNK